MTRTAALVVSAAAFLSLAGCGGGSLVPTAGEAGASPSATPSSAATSSAPPPASTARAVQPTGTAATAPAPPATTSTAHPSVSPAAPAQTPGSNSPALASVRTDVQRVASALEVYYQDREYPLDLAQVRSTLPEAGVTLTAGNTIAGYDYRYEGDAVEFVLCLESTSGAFATYDTAPMTLLSSGGSGGCPG